MFTRSLDIGILMHDNGEYEITVKEPESGLSAMFGPYEPKSMYYENENYLEDLHNEIVSWLCIMDEEREANNEV